MRKDSLIQEVAKNQIEKTKQVYLISPERMFSEYNGEKEYVKNYNGRQLLEMLQNADDAASLAKEEKKVLIKLRGKQLIIANTGHPFFKEGLISIFHSHLSPKEAQQNQIGNKGLGFRSILSWANKVTIKSHELCVAFSEEYSHSVLKELLNNPEVLNFYNRYKKKGQDFPISTLVCPDITSVNPEIFNDYIDYDTIILIDLKEDSLLDVNQQIQKDLDGEVLLFLNYLQCIKLDIDGTDKIYRKEQISESRIKLTTFDRSISSAPIEKFWNINSISGHFEELDRSYQLSVAFKDELDEEKDIVYSYFRTKVPFKIKGILHGTFELNADRNDIINENIYNKKLVELVPKLISNTAEIIAKKENLLKNYKALSFTIFDKNFLPPIMIESDFSSKLNEEINDKKIFPTISDEYISMLDEPVFYDQDALTNLLPKEKFSDILSYTRDEEILAFLNNSKKFFYKFKELSRAISTRRKQYSFKEYASLVKALIQYVDLDEEEVVLEEEKEVGSLCLFYDLNFNPLSFDNSIFLPSDQNDGRLPSEVGVQIIHPKLVEELKLLFQVTTNTSLAENLNKYNIKTFNFNEIVGLLLDHFYSQKPTNPDIIKLNQYIFNLYKNEKPSNKSWVGKSVPLITKNKKIKNANELYFGKEYANAITETVFRYDLSKIVIDPKEFDIDEADRGIWKSYLTWLGVAELPRLIQKSGIEEFAEYAFKKFDYKNNIGDYRFTNFEEFKKHSKYFASIEILSIDDMENIIAKNSCETIIAWLSSDDSVMKLLETDAEPEGSRIQVHFSNTIKLREIRGKQIRNFIKWKLSKTVWLNTKSGIKQAPSLCTSSATITEEFSPLIEKPNINYDAQILKINNIYPEKVDYILNLVGVNKTISSFETKTLYQILNTLSEIDVEGKKAKTLYRELAINYEEKNLDTSESEYKNFIARGKVFCKNNKVFSYKSASSVFYVDNKRYGDSIINQFDTIDIDRRRSQEKIKKIFGVNPLKGLSLTLAKKPNLHKLNEVFEKEIESFKPYVYVFRNDLDVTGREKNLIKDIQFKLVTDLNIVLEKDNERSELTLFDYEYIYLSNEKNIYIKTPESIIDLRILKDDISFCSTIAEAFSALIDVDAQRQQIRELFSKSVTNREDILRSELDDYNLEKLRIVREKLGIVNDPKMSFWLSFLKCLKIKYNPTENPTDESLLSELKSSLPELSNTISDIFDLINYENYNEESSLRIIVDLLKKSNVTLANINKFIYPSISIEEIYSLDFERIKSDKKSTFKRVLYSNFLNSETDRKEFLNKLNEYDSLKGLFDYNLNYDVEHDLNLQVLQIFQLTFNNEYDFNFEEIYSSNKNCYEARAAEQLISKSLANQFLIENPSSESLLYFNNEVNALVERLKEWLLRSGEINKEKVKRSAINKITVGDSAYFYEDYEDLFNQLENDVSFQTNFSKIKIKNLDEENHNHSKIGIKTTKSTKKIKQLAEDFGFVGEWIVYRHLLNSIKNKESVKWVSEYAKSAGVNSDGKNGLGYDIEYIPNDAKYCRYVEVKVVGWENAFHISSNEITQGEKLKKHYEIFLVRNITELDNISIEIIQGPFDYKANKSFTNNDLFSVINDSFILKFEKIDD